MSVEVWWSSDQHVAAFEILRSQTEMSGPDVESALYVLAAMGGRVERFVQSDSIELPALLAASKPWSSGEQALVRLAATLFNATAWPAHIDDLLSSLDPDNFEVAIQALRIRYRRPDPR